MFVALDSNENRIYADNPEKYYECFCPVCKDRLIHKMGKYKKPYFSHRANSDCYYGNDKNNKSEWHLRMQEYFPKECREVRFIDEKTNEIHIADIYIPKEKIVIEFQHSPITLEEFNKRTFFHLNNKRKIIWVFDESKENNKENERGRLKIDDFCSPGWPYNGYTYKWLRNPRKFLADSISISEHYHNYAVYIYTGCEGESIRRIVQEYYDFEYVSLSFMKFDINNITKINDLFIGDDYWLKYGPLREEYIKRTQIEVARIKQREERARSIKLIHSNKRRFRF